jgi:predicted nucleic acid-binding protein
MIFVDTGAWVALEDKRDIHHAAASKVIIERLGIVEVFSFDHHFERHKER